MLARNIGGVVANSKMQKTLLGLADRWLIENAKDAGLNIEGYEHEVTDVFVVHILKRHGNQAIERGRGQIAITQADFVKIPEVIKAPDLALVGGKRGARNIIAYAKKMADNTTLYFEEVIEGSKIKALRSMSLFKWTGDVDAKLFENIIAGNGKTDISGAKIIAEPGGQPGKLPAESQARVPIPSASADGVNRDTNDSVNGRKSQ
jgi:hypothetical protein